MELILRVTFSLLVVLGLMWFLARLARRSGLRGKDAETLTVLDRRQLTRGASVAIVRVAGRALVLGVTDAQVTLLGEADLAAVQTDPGEVEQRRPVPVQARAFEDGAGLGLGTDLDPAPRPASTLIGAPGLKQEPGGRLAGSALSPQTWATAVEVLRARTVRKP